ncbi:hypothetical protein [Muricoccus radiodurans]|uniref:hypothetical protein n=1 Tax=Muricoccus radiodurans TaxID=2231721 RepID=UPI003CFAD459
MPWVANTLSDELGVGTKLLLAHTYVGNRRRVQSGEHLEVQFGQMLQRIYVVSATPKEMILETQVGTRWKATPATRSEKIQGFQEGKGTGERWVVRGEVTPG